MLTDSISGAVRAIFGNCSPDRATRSGRSLHRAAQRPDPVAGPMINSAKSGVALATLQCRPRVSLALNPGYRFARSTAMQPPRCAGRHEKRQPRSFAAGGLAMSLAFRLLFGLEVFTGLLVDHLHRQPNLTAFVEA